MTENGWKGRAELVQTVDEILDSVVLITSTVNNKFGTGFAVRCEQNATWIVTCAHVVKDVGGVGKVLVDDKPANVLAPRNLELEEVDLAVLKVQGLARLPLKIGFIGKKDMPCAIAGFAKRIVKQEVAEPLEGKLGSRILFKSPKGPRVTGWRLWIEGKTHLEPGYSGSPVMCIASRTVIAVASHSENSGEQGYGVCLAHLKDIWPELPADLFSPQPQTPAWQAREKREFLENLFRKLPVSIEQLLRTWCHEAMPPNLPHEIAADANSLDLLDWLEQRGRLSGGQVPLLSVLRRLSPLIVDADDRDRLKQCIEDIGRRFGIPDVSCLGETALPKTAARPALMLEIWPKAPPGNRCNIQGWLIYSAEQNFKVYPKEGEDTLNLDSEEDLTRLVDDLRGTLSEYNVNEKQLIVEFILSRELLGQAVEQWMDGFGDPLGMCFPVVVRSRERLRDRRQQLGWATCWQNLSARRERALSNSLWWLKESERREVHGKLQEGVCIALCFVPDLRAPAQQNAVWYLLHHGSPVMLWPRREADLAYFAALAGQFRNPAYWPDCIVAAQSVGQLPEAVRHIRYDLWRDHKENAPCYHLTLLWDDPTRRIPDEPKNDDDFLQGPV